jgi:hypothetical protein
MNTNHSKNAFEIRLNILQMAHADAQMKYLEKLNTVRDNSGKVTDKELIDELFPKSVDIIARAEELYKFVEGPKGL